MRHTFGDARLPESFWQRVYPEPMSGCWLWSGSLNGNGYGWFCLFARLAHRVSYTALVGLIKERTLDHLCRTISCVNPDHLEDVSGRTNILRSPTSPSAVNARKTHCKRGHALTPDNLRPVKNNKRECRICIKELNRQANLRRPSRAKQR